MIPHKTPEWVAGTLAAGALVYSLCVAHQGWGVAVPACGSWPEVKIKEVIILACWTLLPPIWFWFEYFFIYKSPKNAAPKPDFESFKYGQDASSKIWIATASVLLVLYFGKDIKL